jgi:O-succinylbenzoate synthase
MADLSEHSPIPIALDEELIGIHDTRSRKKLIETIQPAYIVLKPSLIGGIESSIEWIKIAGEEGTGYWVTSALESNIGLNAIAQWAYTLNNNDVVHGLGTGQVYDNNIPSPLKIEADKLRYNPGQEWDFNRLKQ